ncbi:MAG: AAA family ATPase, partial [Planctomycetota bacterium]
MRLAKLTLTGFKSFADRTEFTFDDALTGIVGPNGCGKSNVVDAIKWVLGERSSKSLRGKEMIDVIFAGSSARKPAGMAAVALAFDNPIIAGRADQAQAAAALEAPDATEATDGSAESDPNAEPDSELTSAPTLIDRRAARRRGLPIDADEVEVERRLYRDGTSQYLINGKRARLRDIRELFLDTGIGADAYSIIEQGKVDAMLLASPIERRNIFEEAAGIARYKQRRIESQRKLEKTEQNLLLTREQLESTERRLRLVKGQAAKARVFQQLDDEYQALRLAVAFEQYDDLRQRLEGLTSRLERLEGERSVAQSDLQAAEADQQTADLAVAKINDEQRTAVAARTEAGHRIERARERKTMSERAIADAERQAQTDRERHREAAARIEQLEAQAADLREQAAALAETLSEAERRLAEAEEQRAAAAERSTTSQTALASKRAAAANIDRERTHLLASVQSDEKRAEQVREQLAKLADRAAGLEGDASALERERAAVATEHDRRKQTIADVEAKLASQDASSASLSDDRQRQASHLSDLEQSAVRLDSRRQTLDEMLTSRVGLGEAVRDVLERRDAGTGFASVIAPLAELIQTEADHASVVEAALGGSLRALVVNAIDDLPSPAERDDLAGRVTFVPIARVSAPAIGDRRALPDLSSFAGRVTPLRALVRPADTLSDPHLAERVAALLDRLLGETYAVTDIDAAMMLA